MPIAYDPLRKRFQVKGNFCSWGCVKSYIGDNHTFNSHTYRTLLTLLVKRLEGRIRSIEPAPPRTTLKEFGGSLSIEEFRGCSKEKYYSIHEQQMIFVNNSIDEFSQQIVKKKKKKKTNSRS